MAKANANKAPDAETRKLLWLKIARREVERCRSTDIEDAMRVLQARKHKQKRKRKKTRKKKYLVVVSYY